MDQLFWKKTLNINSKKEGVLLSLFFHIASHIVWAQTFTNTLVFTFKILIFVFNFVYVELGTHE